MFWWTKCGHCGKTDFKANMEKHKEPCGMADWMTVWYHKECYLEANDLRECPHCEGDGTIPVDSEE